MYTHFYCCSGYIGLNWCFHFYFIVAAATTKTTKMQRMCINGCTIQYKVHETTQQYCRNSNIKAGVDSNLYFVNCCYFFPHSLKLTQFTSVSLCSHLPALLCIGKMCFFEAAKMRVITHVFICMCVCARILNGFSIPSAVQSKKVNTYKATV